MKALAFPKPFLHDHPQVENVNRIDEQRLTFGHRAADRVTGLMGSWKFILIQSGILMVWGALNVSAYIFHWDPYPFILMNLVLSLQAAYAAPVIMMSQNRQAARDRIEAQRDYEIDEKAETEIRAVLDHLVAQDRALEEIHRILMSGREAQRPAPGADRSG